MALDEASGTGDGGGGPGLAQLSSPGGAKPNSIAIIIVRRPPVRRPGRPPIPCDITLRALRVRG